MYGLTRRISWNPWSPLSATGGRRSLRDVSRFIVQSSIWADQWDRRGYSTADEALAHIRELIDEDLAEPGELNVVEEDESGRAVKVLDLPGHEPRAPRWKREPSPSEP